MIALDRTTMVSDVLAPYGVVASPVENRLYLPDEPGYNADGSGYDQPAQSAALALLAANGYTFTNDTLYSPNGKPVDLSLFVPSADPVAQQLAALIAGSCAAIGVTVTPDEGGPPAASKGVSSAWAGSIWPGSVGAGSGLARGGPVPAGSFAAGSSGSAQAGSAQAGSAQAGSAQRGSGQAVGPRAGWQMAIELRQVPATPSSIASRYATTGSDNIDSYSSATMDALLGQIPTATPAELPDLYDQIDTQAWKDFVDLPLVPVPVVVVVNPHLLNVKAGPYFDDMAWDEQNWGFRSP
jgi:hypothetical protein